MAARIKVYLDEECTQELYREESGYFFYRYRKLNADGSYTTYFNGNEGGEGTATLYLKNIGTKAALNLVIYASQKEGTPIVEYTSYEIGDIAVEEVKEVNINFSIGYWTEAQVNKTNLVLDYYSLPDILSESNPYNKASYHVPETDNIPKKEMHLGDDSKLKGVDYD